MESCQVCGAAIGSDAEWCGQCYAVAGRAPAASPASVPATARAGTATAAMPATTSVMAASRGAATLAPTVVKSRWRKTDTTFGPVGRLIATVALVVPFLVFVVVGIFTGGLTIAGALIWGFVIMPWGLRDTWKAGQLTAR